ERRGERRPGREADSGHGLEHSEDAPEHFLRRASLQQCEARDVDERVTDATTPKSTSASDARGNAATAASGSPQSTIPIPKSEASRLRPTSPAATIAPSTPPIPSAALSQPTPAAPSPVIRSAS